MRRFLLLLAILCLPALPVIAQEGDGIEPPGTWFPVETLNAGLAPVPDYVLRDTPQGAVESFLDLVDDGDLDAAAHLLDLTSVPPEDQALRGPVLAMQLHSVLERRAILSWSMLLERPDGVDSRAPDSAAMAGQPRRSLILGVLSINGREAAIRLNRVRPNGGDPVWVFSNRTVQRVPELYQRYGPTRMERALPEWTKMETLVGLRAFELFGLPLTLLLAWITARLTYDVFQRLSRRAKGYWSTIALKALRWPLIIVFTTTVVLLVALKIFNVSGGLAAVLTPLTLIGYVVAFLMFSLSLLDTALDRVVTLDSDKLADPENSTIRNYATLMTAGRRFVMVIGVIVGLGIVLASANVFRSLGFSLLASAGALTLILGFAARHVLGNILASLQIALNRSARIGDRVIYDGRYCTVERIHFTYIQLKTWTDNRMIVPVSKFVGDEFENWSMVTGSMVCRVPITFEQDVDIDAVQEIFDRLCGENEDVVESVDNAAVAYSQDAFGITMEFRFRVDDPNKTYQAQYDMLEAVVKEVQAKEREDGIKMLARVGMDDLTRA
ncbi:Mechanosensitive channel MscK precursor [Rhodobacteraceae bacterium THAF1]|uniref:mechanosensitive ion channel family protein n=1 Tax=Palleronia sp. THAF1 TaxID=2587842 RepID=UPI000F41119F|nr:mechanosensitive ion channel domain-containing protein [Palleronia sp. THAF1]QFU08307.1 Mechanosensitive channel MscK precursor [Palleronia sp. THAF1]VDC28930.1 Mechanosensitive channel MscK precursor [Rhodobacteraceae bacterium THAF1]